jgi:hypothetical protein
MAHLNRRLRSFGSAVVHDGIGREWLEELARKIIVCSLCLENSHETLSLFGPGDETPTERVVFYEGQILMADDFWKPHKCL